MLPQYFEPATAVVINVFHIHIFNVFGHNVQTKIANIIKNDSLICLCKNGYIKMNQSLHYLYTTNILIRKYAWYLFMYIIHSKTF